MQSRNPSHIFKPQKFWEHRKIERLKPDSIAAAQQQTSPSSSSLPTPTSSSSSLASVTITLFTCPNPMDSTTFSNCRASSLSHPYRLQSSPFPLHIPFLKLKRLGLDKNRLITRCTSGSDELGSVNGLQFTPNKLFTQEAIGAEYGEGFETFRADGPLKVDVDYLNDKLQNGFLQRIRYAMKPDEAYGLIFSWDNVVVDTRALKRKTWNQLASEEGKDIPKGSDVERLMLYGGADHVLHKHFLPDKADNEMDRLKLRFSQIYYDNLRKLERPAEGLKDWLEAVSTARIPCAVVSSLDRRNMVEALERMGLSKYFQAIVTEEDGMESIAHRFLSAAVKLDRKPAKCVVFEDDPRGVTAAHNCTMMAVALIGAHPAYDLGQADLTVANYSELSVINLRRLFANNGSTFMDLQKQIIEKNPPKRNLTIDTIF